VNLLDWVLVGLVLTYALSGYWQGFVTGACATAGLLLGGLTGVWLAPLALGDANPSVLVSLGALFIVILTASLGQAVFQYAGARLRDTIRWQPFRAVDAVGGAALSGAAVLLVSWALGVAVAGSGITGITPLVRESTVLKTVDELLPDSAANLLKAFNNVVGTTFFPRYLEPFAPERIVPVGPGPQRLLTDPDVVRAESAVVKIQSVNSCGRGIEGSGFLFARDRVMTNAHVVAGVDEPKIEIGGETLKATVVYYDPDVDIAVLAVDSGDLTTLPFDTEVQPQQGVAILGYPQDGPYDVQTARVRSEQRLRSPNIYGDGAVIREVLSLRGKVRPGNSGGPVVSSGGDVVGVVFAASLTDSDTGYALTADQVAEAATLGVGAGAPVDTQDCAG
jgi:Trypsin-like peptidase domain/Colicin V production protein